MWSTCIFDLDGTLVDSVDVIIDSFQHVHRTCLSIEVGEEEVRTWIGRTLADIYTDIAPERTDELIAAFVDYNLARLADEQRDIPGMADVVAALTAHHITTAVATSKRRVAADISLDAAGITVDHVVAMDDTDHHKPDPAPLLEVARRVGVDPASCVYVGDAATDVEAAQAAGMGSIAVTWGAVNAAALRAAQPDHLVTTVSELTEVLTARCRPSNHFDHAAATWEQHGGHADRSAALARQIADAAGEDCGRALEYGCGTGSVSRDLADVRPGMGPIDLADTSAGMRAEAEKLAAAFPGWRVIDLDLTATDADAAAYDLVYSAMVLHHIDDVPALLHQFHRALRPGGMCVVFDLDAEDGSYHAADVPVSHHGIDRDGLANWLADAGFTDVETATAWTATRERDGVEREYTIFRAVARRP